MLNTNNNSVIIDFGSCTPIDYRLEDIEHTYEWFDNDVDVAALSNNLDALEEIREWLSETA